MTGAGERKSAKFDGYVSFKTQERATGNFGYCSVLISDYE
jgi:hypothetical protein